MKQMTFLPAVALRSVALAMLVAAAPVGAQQEAAERGSAKSEAASSASDAVAAYRKAEHERIQRERTAVQAQRQTEEAACYRRFAVEDCLRGVRARSRDALARLRTQEIELNDAERREKAAARRQSIDEKQGSSAADRPASGNAPKLRNPASDPQATKAQRDLEAEQRARQQRSHVQRQAQEQAARSSVNAERAGLGRARHEEALKAAQERRARVEKSQADAAAQGRRPAAPLPPAP